MPMEPAFKKDPGHVTRSPRSGSRAFVGSVICQDRLPPARPKLSEVEQKQLDRRLFQAVENGQMDETRDLIAAGADVNARDQSRWTPLCSAASKGRAEIARLLIDSGTFVEARTRVACTPLMLAAYGGHVRTVELLIECGADVNATDACGKRVLHWALASPSGAVAILKQHGAHL
jgi:ankyrin repeat protein